MSASEQAAAEDAAREERWRKATHLMETIPAMADDLRTMLRHDMANFLQVDVSLFYGAPPAPVAAPPPPVAAAHPAPHVAQHAAPLHIAAQTMVAVPSAPPVPAHHSISPITAATPPGSVTTRPAPTTAAPTVVPAGLPIDAWRTAHHNSPPIAAITDQQRTAPGRAHAEPASRATPVVSPQRVSPLSSSSSVVPAPARRGGVPTAAPPAPPPGRVARASARPPAQSESTRGRDAMAPQQEIPRYKDRVFNEAARNVMVRAFNENPRPSQEEVNSLRVQFGLQALLQPPYYDCPIYRWFAKRRSEAKRANQQVAEINHATPKNSGSNPAKVVSASRGETSTGAKRPPPAVTAPGKAPSLPNLRPLPTPRPSAPNPAPAQAPRPAAAAVTASSATWNGRQFSDAAEAVLETAFARNSTPTRPQIARLRDELKIPGRVPADLTACPIHAWFHNRRARNKKRAHSPPRVADASEDGVSDDGAPEPASKRRPPRADASNKAPGNAKLPRSPTVTRPTVASPSRGNTDGGDSPSRNRPQPSQSSSAPPRTGNMTFTHKSLCTLERTYSDTPYIDAETLAELRAQLRVRKILGEECAIQKWFKRRRAVDRKNGITLSAPVKEATRSQKMSPDVDNMAARRTVPLSLSADVVAQFEAIFQKTPCPPREIVDEWRVKLGLPSRANIDGDWTTCCPVYKWFSTRRSRARREAAVKPVTRNGNAGEAFRRVDADPVIPKETISKEDEAILQAAFEKNPGMQRETIDALRVQIGLPSRAGWKHPNYTQVWRFGCPVVRWYNRQRVLSQRAKRHAESVLVGLNGMQSDADDDMESGDEFQESGQAYQSTQEPAEHLAPEPTDVDATDEIEAALAAHEEPEFESAPDTEEASGGEIALVHESMPMEMAFEQQSRKRPSDDNEENPSQQEGEYNLAPREEGDSTPSTPSKRQRLDE